MSSPVMRCQVSATSVKATGSARSLAGVPSGQTMMRSGPSPSGAASPCRAPVARRGTEGAGRSRQRRRGTSCGSPRCRESRTRPPRARRYGRRRSPPGRRCAAAGRRPGSHRDTDHRSLERIAARRAELDLLIEELAQRLEEARAEREELAVAEKVLRRLEEQVTAETPAVRPAQVGGRCCWCRIGNRTWARPPPMSGATGVIAGFGPWHYR